MSDRRLALPNGSSVPFADAVPGTWTIAIFYPAWGEIIDTRGTAEGSYEAPSGYEETSIPGCGYAIRWVPGTEERAGLGFYCACGPDGIECESCKTTHALGERP